MSPKLKRAFDSYGLQRVPDEISYRCGCRICLNAFPNTDTLWTQESLREPTDPKAYSSWLNNLAASCYCTTHAESHVVGLPPQQFFLSKDGRTKYLISRNFPEDEVDAG